MKSATIKKAGQAIKKAMTAKGRKISTKLKGRKRGGKGTSSATTTPKKSIGERKPLSLKENEGFTGYRTGTSTKKPTQSAKAAQDRMGGMTGYVPKSSQKKRSKQGEYTNNMKKFLASK